MFIDYAQTKPYAEYLQSAACEYQATQYDVALMRQGLRKISAWLGQRLLGRKQRLPSSPPIMQLGTHWRS